MDTKESYINRVACYMNQNLCGKVDRAVFEQVCAACEVDPRSFDQQDLNESQCKQDVLTRY